MPIPPLLLDLGKVIGQHYLKSWWKRTQELSTASGLAKNLLTDPSASLTYREAERQFASLGDKLADDLRPLIDSASSVDEGEKEAVILAASEAFGAAGLTPELLASRDLDPRQISDHIKAARPNATRDFSTDGGELYRRLIHEASLRIVAVAPEVRPVPWAVDREVLTRLADLSRNVDLVLEQLHRVEATSENLNDDAAAARFETAYRQTIAARLDKLELFGVENLSSASRRQAVTVAFVSLRTTLSGVAKHGFDQLLNVRVDQALSAKFEELLNVNVDQQTADAAETAIALRAARVRVNDVVSRLGLGSTQATGFGGMGKTLLTTSVSQLSPSYRNTRIDAPIEVPIETILANARRLLIRGGAGSGKSTVLQWVAVQAALSKLDRPLDAWNDLVPFFIRLRDHPDGNFPDARDLPRVAVGDRADFCPPGWAQALLDKGRAVILVDGVDEVSESIRPKVRDWLVQLTSAFPNARYIVTSRPTAADADWLADLGFLSAELQPLDSQTISKFVSCWHDAVKLTVPNSEHKHLDHLASRLTSRIRQSPALVDIASTPLLCALLCALNRERDGEIPDDRLSLYEAACKMLVEKRDLDRGIRATDYPTLTETQKLLLLQDLAYWLVRNEQVAVQDTQVDSCLRRRLGDMREAPSPNLAGRVRAFFEDRSGLIRSPEDGVLEFVHNSFREYLAAQELLRLNDIGEARKNAHDDRWREVILMAAAVAGRANVNQYHQMVDQIMRRGDRFKNRRHQLHLLAAACQNLSPDIDARLQAEIDQRLQAIVPPKSEIEARAIATAGDLAVSHLLPHSEDPNVIPFCISALGRIGTEAALDALAVYADGSRENVLTAILAQWQRFDRDEFANRILPRIASRTDLRTLDLSEIPVTDDDVARLKSLTGLERLILTRTRITDAGLTHLAGLTSLKVLGLAHTSITDSGLAHLAGLTSVENLDLGGVVVSEAVLAFLTGMRDLKSISFSYSHIPDMALARIGEITSLRGLFLDFSDVTDDGLAHLKGLTNLNTLSFSEARITDAGLVHLAGLGNLEALWFDGTGITDTGLNYISCLTKLRTLWLDRTAITDVGVAYLAHLSALTELHADDTEITDEGLAHLAGLVNLERLDLDGTKVSDRGVTHLLCLTNLKILFLNRTNVTADGKARLTAMVNLKELYVSDGNSPNLLDQSLASLRRSEGRRSRLARL